MTTPSLPTGDTVDVDVIDERLQTRNRAVRRGVINITLGLVTATVVYLAGRYAPGVIAEPIGVGADVIRAFTFAAAVGMVIYTIGDIRAMMGKLGENDAYHLLNLIVLGLSYIGAAVSLAVLALWTRDVAAWTGIRPTVVGYAAGWYAGMSLLAVALESRTLMYSATLRAGRRWDLFWQHEIDLNKREIDEVLEEAGITTTGTDGVRELARRFRAVSA
jgi:hypothetical protein